MKQDDGWAARSRELLCIFSGRGHWKLLFLYLHKHCQKWPTELITCRLPAWRGAASVRRLSGCTTVWCRHFDALFVVPSLFQSLRSPVDATLATCLLVSCSQAAAVAKISAHLFSGFLHAGRGCLWFSISPQAAWLQLWWLQAQIRVTVPHSEIPSLRSSTQQPVIMSPCIFHLSPAFQPTGVRSRAHQGGYRIQPD